MKYEIQLDSDGTIIHAQASGSPWGKLELEDSQFKYIESEVSEKKLSRLIGAGYKYIDDEWINPKNQEKYNDDLLFDGDDFHKTLKLFPDYKERENWCNSLDPNWKDKQESPCLFLHGWHTGFDPHTISGFIDTRKYWFNKFSKFKKLNGIKNVLAYCFYGDYAMIGQCVNQLPRLTIDTLLSDDIFTDEDKAYMTWLGKW